MNAAALVDELRAPRCFPNAPPDVQIVQTHLSVVCLAGDRVYKLKKALHLPFVDFSTLAQRRAICRDEVRLNRRLCPDTYLGTCALRRGPDGLRFAAVGDDEDEHDLDVAVVMRRLPAERMLDVLLAQGTVTTTDVRGLAVQVAAFHAGADDGPQVRAAGDPDQLARDNFRELAPLAGAAPHRALLRELERVCLADLDALLPALRRRCAAGRVRDGHGDLHARNICMTAPPTIYDCLEFSAAFRCGDVATENAFLAMDLRYRGAAPLAREYVAAYVDASGDSELPSLLPPLVAYRAMVRAKVAAIAAAQPELAEDARAEARRSTRRHLWLAAACASEVRSPHWLLFCGPPASGKTHLAGTLCAATAWPHHNTDVVRKELAGVSPTRPARPEHYTAEFSQRTYGELLRRAEADTRTGAAVVVLDGNFPSPQHREHARKAAIAAGVRLHVVHVDVDAATAVARAAARDGQASVSDAGPELAAELRRHFVPPAADEADAVHRLDGAAPAERSIDRLLTDLLATAQPTT